PDHGLGTGHEMGPAPAGDGWAMGRRHLRVAGGRAGSCGCEHPCQRTAAYRLLVWRRALPPLPAVVAPRCGGAKQPNHRRGASSLYAFAVPYLRAVWGDLLFRLGMCCQWTVLAMHGL